MSTCPFCDLDPYEYVDVGIGYVPVAVNCCQWGPLLFDWRTDKADYAKAKEVAAEIEAGRMTREQADDALYKHFSPDAECRPQSESAAGHK